MSPAHGVMAVETADWAGAGVAIGAALIAVTLLRALFSRRATNLPPEAETRLRLVERLTYAVILTIGIAIALSKFEAVRVVGSALLTSSAIAAAIVGFAARQTLANVVAGLMLAITQPLRLGDRIVFEEHTGTVEDVTLSYTFLRTLAGERLAIPNEKLASGVLRNDTIVPRPLAVEASVWADHDERALETLAEEGSAAIAETSPEGIRIVVRSGEAPAAERPALQEALRARCIGRLREADLLPRGNR